MKFDTSVKLAGITFRNPVLVASGTFGYGDEITDLVDVSKLGGIITKTITLQPKEGNPPPRLFETASGILNAIGLQNIGIKKFIKEKSVYLGKLPVPVIVSIAGESANDYALLAAELNNHEWVKAIELNLSCPNLDKQVICKNIELVKEIIKGVKSATKIPVIAKLSPDVGDLPGLAQAAKDSVADAVSLVNTFPGMAIDIKTRKPRLSNVTGGLSGPAIKPLALRCVWEVFKSVAIPIIGGGGITTAEDAVEFMFAGASLVTVGTANFLDPESAVNIAKGITKYMKENNVIKRYHR